jgi:hypothetical protein
MVMEKLCFFHVVTQYLHNHWGVLLSPSRRLCCFFRNVMAEDVVDASVAQYISDEWVDRTNIIAS